MRSGRPYSERGTAGNRLSPALFASAQRCAEDEEGVGSANGVHPLQCFSIIEHSFYVVKHFLLAQIMKNTPIDSFWHIAQRQGLCYIRIGLGDRGWQPGRQRRSSARDHYSDRTVRAPLAGQPLAEACEPRMFRGCFCRSLKGRCMSTDGCGLAIRKPHNNLLGSYLSWYIACFHTGNS